jgi:hypothetical protein
MRFIFPVFFIPNVIIDGSNACRYNIPADIESMAWDPFQAFHLYCALEDGLLICIDIRKQDGPLFTLQAHNATLSSLSFSSSVPGKTIFFGGYTSFRRFLRFFLQ